MPTSMVKVVNKPTEKKATAPADNPKAEKKIPKDASSTDNKKKKRSNKSLENCKIYMFNVLKKVLMLKYPPTQLYQHLWTTTQIKPVGDTTTMYLN